MVSVSATYRRFMRGAEQVPQSAIEYRSEAYPKVEEAVLTALRGGAARVVLDLDPVDDLDATATRGLIVLLRRARKAGGELALRSSRAETLRRLSVMGLDRVFPILRPQAA